MGGEAPKKENTKKRKHQKKKTPKKETSLVENIVENIYLFFLSSMGGVEVEKVI